MVGQERRNSVRRLWRTLNAAVGVVTTTFGIGLLLLEAADIMRRDGLSLQTICKLILLSCVGLLILGWLIFPKKELKLLIRWVDPPEGGFEVHPVLIYADALLLISLIFACRNPLWFGVAYFVYNGANLFGAIYSTDTIKCALCKTEQTTTDETRKKALRYLQAYYVQKPNILRIAAMTVLGLGALAVAAYGTFHGRNVFSSAAYVLCAVSLIVFEGVMLIWRRPLYGQLSRLAVPEHSSPEI